MSILRTPGPKRAALEWILFFFALQTVACFVRSFYFGEHRTTPLGPIKLRKGFRQGRGPRMFSVGEFQVPSLR